jgi:hypothetical protein
LAERSAIDPSTVEPTKFATADDSFESDQEYEEFLADLYGLPARRPPVSLVVIDTDGASALLRRHAPYSLGRLLAGKTVAITFVNPQRAVSTQRSSRHRVTDRRRRDLPAHRRPSRSSPPAFAPTSLPPCRSWAPRERHHDARSSHPGGSPIRPTIRAYGAQGAASLFPLTMTARGVQAGLDS